MNKINTYLNFFLNSIFHMVDVGDKNITKRAALAIGEIFIGESLFKIVREKKLIKGDVLTLSEVAGIFGVKKTSELLPLCHTLCLSSVKFFSFLRESDFTIVIYCFTSSEAKTGVEMESLCGVVVCLLTIYDLVKLVSPCIFMSNIKLLLKLGGKSGIFINKSWYMRFLFMMFFKKFKLPFLGFSVAIISVGTRLRKFNYINNSGNLLYSLFKKYGASINYYFRVYDDDSQLRFALNKLFLQNSICLDIIVTIGGTGPSLKDKTCDVLLEFCKKNFVGVSEMLRFYTSFFSKFSYFSNCIVGVTNSKVLIISIPGSVNAVFEYFYLLLPLLNHLFTLVRK